MSVYSEYERREGRIDLLIFSGLKFFQHSGSDVTRQLPLKIGISDQGQREIILLSSYGSGSQLISDNSSGVLQAPQMPGGPAHGVGMTPTLWNDSVSVRKTPSSLPFQISSAGS